MADDIGGLEVNFTAEASQLRSELQRVEQQLRQFERAHGRQKVQISAGFESPGQRRVDDFRRDVQKRVGAVPVPVRLEVPVQQNLDKFVSGLGAKIGTVPVTVKGVWGGWQTPPPSEITVNVRGGGTGSAGGAAAASRAAREPAVRAPAATTMAVTGRLTRDEIHRAREENRRRERTGAVAPSAPARTAPTAETRRIRQVAGNEARAAAQTQTASRATVFKDWSDQELLAEYLDTKAKGGSRTWLSSAERELVARGFDPSKGAPGTGGARGFAAVPSRPVGGTSAARGKGIAAPQLAAGQQISRTVRPGKGQTMAEHVLQAAVRTSAPPPEAVSMSRLRSLIPQLSAGNRERGEAWYPEANKALKRLRSAYGLDERINDAQLAGIAGVFSANADWPQNLRLVSGFFQRMQQGVDPSNAEGFLGIGTFVDPIVKAAQIAAMNNPSMAQIAGRRDVQTGEQWLAGKQGKGSFFGDKTGPFTGALHAGAGAKQEAEARSVWSVLAPMDRWMTRSIHGIENVGAMAHRQGWKAISSLLKRSGFKTDFGFQAGIWDLTGPAQAEADPWDGHVPPPLPAASRTPPTRASILAERAAARGASPASGAPQIAAFMRPTPQSLMVSPGEHIDPITGTPTMAAHQMYGEMVARERTPTEAHIVAARQRANREQAAQARMFARFSSGPGVGIAAFARPRTRLSSAAEKAMERATGGGTSLAEQMLGNPEDLSPEAVAAMGTTGAEAPRSRALTRAGLNRTQPGGTAARLDELLRANREAIAITRGAGQVRAVGTTTAGIFANLFGGKAQRELVLRDLQILGTELGRVRDEGKDAFDAMDTAARNLAEGRSIKAPADEIARLEGNLQKAAAAAKPWSDAAGEIEERMTKLHGSVNGFKAASIGFVSSIAGTLVGLGVFQAVTTAVGGLAAALQEPADRLMGFRMTADRVAPSLGQLVRQYNGLADVAVETATAQSGLGRSTADQINPILQQRAAVEGGNTAFREQLDLIRSAGFFQNNPNAGLTQSTGGFFGTPLGAQQPFLEQLLQSGSPVGGPLESGFARRVGGGAMIGAGVGLGIGAIGGPVGAGAGALIGGAGGAIAGLLAGVLSPDEAQTFAERSRRGQLTEEETQRLNEFNQALSSTNEAAERASPRVAATARAVSLLSDTSEKANTAVATTQKLLTDLGASPDQLRAAEAMRFAIVNPQTGRGVRDEGAAREFLNTALRGFTMPDRDAAVAQTTQQLAASLQLAQQQGELARGTILPGQQYLSGLASGRLNVGGARRGGFGIRDLPPEVARTAPNFDTITEQLTELQQAQSSVAQTGRTELIGMLQSADAIMSKATGSASNLTGTFQTLEASIGANAGAMRGLQVENMWAQVNLQVAQYDEQLRVANRSLADAQSFLTGMGHGELGLLQRRARGLEIAQAEVGFRQQELGLQSQQLGLQSASLGLRSRELQLMQSQRQINFQRALAGFVTPGATPEEIAARQAEAQIEADFAQQQQNIAVEALGIDRQQVGLQAQNVALAQQALGISKEAFSVQQAMVTVNAARAVEDLTHQIDLLTRARTVTLQVAVNNEAIAAYQDAIARDMEQVQQTIQEAYGVQQQVMQNAAALAASFGERVTDWNNRIISGLNDYLRRASSAVSGAFGGGGSSGGGGGGGGQLVKASGMYSQFSSPTQITVGEAGTETVAVLRNPRTTTLQPSPASGGGDTYIFQISGNSISSERDAEELAATLARKVEETMSRKSSLLGLRGR